jgi:hypothetical protein
MRPGESLQATPKAVNMYAALAFRDVGRILVR